MTGKGGVLIVTVSDTENAEKTERRILKIKGVESAEYNQVTQKLVVKYRGNSATLREIKLAMKNASSASDANNEPKKVRTKPDRRQPGTAH